MNETILSLMTFLPLVGVLLLFFVPKESHNQQRGLALGITILTFLVSLPLVTGFQTNAQFQFVKNVPWIAAGPFQMHYHVGIDGISLLLLLLTTLLTPLAILSSWNSIKDRLKEYMIFMLILETGMLGVVVSLDLFLFYVFWEITLVPMYFLIGIWGGSRRVYAAVKFFLYTMAGSLLMLPLANKSTRGLRKLSAIFTLRSASST